MLINKNSSPAPNPEDFLKISVNPKQVIRTSSESFHPNTCLVSSKGYSESLRQPPDGFFKIGRQQITESGARPNDLMLPPTDRAISRSHCMIDYQIFFNKSAPKTWISFLMSLHPRLGESSIWKYLPLEIFKHIISFLRDTRLPYLIDLGSMCGTYVKVSNTEPVFLKPGSNFLIGSDINIEFDRVENKFCESESEDFMQIDGKDTMEGFNNCYPFVIVKISKVFSDAETTMAAQTYKFESKEGKGVFSIGRSQVCDIIINENTISRVQCRIMFEGKNWKLLDGSDGKPTVNGTWLSISKKNNLVKEHSEPFPLKNGSQVKVSDTILEVSWD